MNEVIPGIFHLPLPIPNPGLDHVNTYLVRADGEFLLIDTGWDTPEVFDSLKGQLTEIGVSFEDISRIVVTHIHVDHYGLAGRLKQLSQAEIALHYVEKRTIFQGGGPFSARRMQRVKIIVFDIFRRRPR